MSEVRLPITGSWRVHTIPSLYLLCGYYEISIWLLYDSYLLLIPSVWYLIICVCNNSDRISRKSRNGLSAIREIRYLRYLLFWFSTIKNQELNKTIDISADTFLALLKSPQKFILTSFLSKNQYSILNYAVWRKWRLWRNSGEVSATSAIPPHVIFIFRVRFLRLSVFTFQFSHKDKDSASILPALDLLTVVQRTSSKINPRLHGVGG